MSLTLFPTSALPNAGPFTYPPALAAATTRPALAAYARASLLDMSLMTPDDDPDEVADDLERNADWHLTLRDREAIKAALDEARVRPAGAA